MNLTPLDVLVGEWRVTGRSRKSDHDDVAGDLTVEPILGGKMLSLVGGMRVGDEVIQSLELIWHEDGKPGYPAHVYSGEAAPLDYRWDIDGDTVIHAGLGMTYTGTISADRRTIAGDWVADPDRPDMIDMTYQATMHRVR